MEEHAPDAQEDPPAMESLPGEVALAERASEPACEAPGLPTERPAPVAALAARLAPLGQRLRATLALLRERFGVRWVYAVVSLLVIVALLLPPISLPWRLGLTGYTVLAAENPSLSHPDGLTVRVDPETFSGRIRVRLGSVPRLIFLEGSAGSALRRAAEALPGHLLVKSPYYEIASRGRPSGLVIIEVTIPNDAEPWETLDLYTWTGESWEWIGGALDVEEEVLVAQVADIPSSVVVVQTEPVAAAISTALDPAEAVDGNAASLLTEVNPTGLLLGTLGGFAGHAADLPQPEGEGSLRQAQDIAYAVIPTLRNWAPGGTVNQGLLRDLLDDPETQQQHIANIVALVVGGGYAGVEIDYRGVTAEDRDSFAAFVAVLAEALHAEGATLSVVVEPATHTSVWNSGGYDWRALGAAADVLKIPFPDDPTAYVEGGEVEQLLSWATSQVSRYKLRMLVSSLSVDLGGDEVNHLALDEALALFGEITTTADVDGVQPGETVSFELDGNLLSVTRDDMIGSYKLEYEDEGGRHTVWLGTGSCLSSKLNWASRYHLGGVAVADLLHAGNSPAVLDAVANYRAEAESLNSDELQVTWTVRRESGEPLMQQSAGLTSLSFTWNAPDEPGPYSVEARIGNVERGSVTVVVTEPVTQTAPPSTTVVVTPTVTTPEAGSGCPNGTYAADVTIPDYSRLGNEEDFTKTWRMRNNGTCAWPEDTVLAFVSGFQLGAPESVSVGAVEPGAQVEVSVPMKAPEESGQFQGEWRLRSGDEFFGGKVTVVIRVGTGSAPVVPPVSGGSFELGGHIQGFQYASQMHYAGMTWAKVQVHYGTDASGIIEAAHANGFKIQLSGLGSPSMVTQPGFENSFAAWVGSLAAAGADAIEVWNEPNIEREWQIGSISPQAYTRLLCASYNAIKSANPGTLVISAAPAPTGWFGGCSPNGCDDLPWLAGLRDAGAAQCMDYIGAHHNAGATSPSARSGHPAGTHHSWYFLPQTELYYSIFGGARQLFYTEMGYVSPQGYCQIPDNFAWGGNTTVAQQAAWLAEAASLGASTGMVRVIIVWNVDFKRYDCGPGYGDPQAGYAIIRPDGSCPACDALHAVLGTR